MGGVDAGDLQVVLHLVEVDLDKAFLHLVDRVIGDGLAYQFAVHGDSEIGRTVFLVEAGNALDVESKGCVLEEEIDVFQVGLYVLGEVGIALGVEVVFDLDLVVLEDFRIGL